jgi:peroxiredoxin Q/BCP
MRGFQGRFALRRPHDRGCRGQEHDAGLPEGRQARPNEALCEDPSFSVIKAYDAAFTIPVVGVAFANRISYVISPEGKILYAYSDSNAEKHIENTLAVVKKWRAEHKR